jgi:molybdate transport system ATP-binding protein
MSLKVAVKKRLNKFELDITIVVGVGEFKVITGPSGAGKSTVIRLIAGLERPDQGLIAYNGTTWVDTDKGVFLRPQKRRVGFVFQDYTLFPHLSVYRNVAFAAQGQGGVERLLRRFGIWHLKDDMPHRISGGERQRCAICQNLVRRPQVLLLDEPFSALDVENRRRLRKELKALQEELCIPVIHVTHDLNEALVLGDSILSIVEGKEARGWFQSQLKETRADVTSHPFSYPLIRQRPSR